MLNLVLPYAVAAVAFWVIFSLKPLGNFWAMMAPGTALLALIALLIRGAGLFSPGFSPSDFALGVASAAILYGVFWAGRFVVPAHQVGAVYEIRRDASPWVVGLLLLLVIGPSEEIFWRGLIQHGLYAWLPGWWAVVVASLAYCAVHIPSRNPVLLLASLVGGLFWGGLYLSVGHIAPVIVSHAVWDLTVLLLLPLGRSAKPEDQAS
jgi:membrane protease YdiL (CAAX protease family)